MSKTCFLSSHQHKNELLRGDEARERILRGIFIVQMYPTQFDVIFPCSLWSCKRFCDFGCFFFLSRFDLFGLMLSFGAISGVSPSLSLSSIARFIQFKRNGAFIILVKGVTLQLILFVWWCPLMTKVDVIFGLFFLLLSFFLPSFSENFFAQFYEIDTIR